MSRILVIDSNFYQDLADQLVRGATAELALHGIRPDRVSVPGALEIPAAIAVIAERNKGPKADQPYDGYVALGCVIRGETSHYDIVSGESARGLMDLAIRCRLIIGNGILTVDTPEQAWIRARADGNGKNKGRDAVQACLSLIEVKRRGVQ